jgi:hypothetical protein
MGIEPTSEAWEACNITQKHAGLAAFSQFSKRLNWKIMENGRQTACGPRFHQNRLLNASNLLQRPESNG